MPQTCRTKVEELETEESQQPTAQDVPESDASPKGALRHGRWPSTTLPPLVQEWAHLRDAEDPTGCWRRGMPRRWKTSWQPKGSGEQAQRRALPVKLSKYTRPAKQAISDMTSELGGIQDQARNGKNRGRPRSHAGAGGARTPRTGQREPEGIPG